MSVWFIIGLVTVLAAGLAVWLPRIDGDSASPLAWLAPDYGSGDDEAQVRARTAAFRVSAPLGALAAIVTVTGVIVSGGASWSGVTSLIGLVLVALTLIAGSVAGRRALRREPVHVEAR